MFKVIHAGEKLRESKKKQKMASSNSTANRDWGKVMMVPVTTFLTEPGKAHNFSPAIILQLLSMFHNLMDVC